MTNHFFDHFFYHHGVAQQLQDLGGLSWFSPALAAVTPDVAGWFWQRGEDVCFGRLRNPGDEKVRSSSKVLR